MVDAVCEARAESPEAAVGYVYDDDATRLDRDVICGWLASSAYWGRWRGRVEIAAQLDSAWRVVGAYDATTGEQVGFARAFSDGVAAAYLADVFVLEAHRGRGLGKGLLRAMIDDGPGHDFRWMLHTADAHDLYRQFGFGPPRPSYLERPAGPGKPAVGLPPAI